MLEGEVRNLHLLFYKIMNKIQSFLQGLLGIQKQPPTQNNGNNQPAQIIPFTPRAAFGLSEPAAFDATEQIKSYSSWVYFAIQKRASSLANIDLRLFRWKKNEAEEIFTHDILDLIDGKENFLTRYDLFEYIGTIMDLSGECFLWKVRNKQGKVISLYPYLNPVYMEVVPSEKDFIGGYVYTVAGSSKKVPFDKNDIIHFKYINPLNPYRGLSPVKAAEFSIATDREASKWNWRFFHNSAKPFGVLKVPGTLTQNQYDRIRTQWETTYKGDGNQHKLAIIEGGSEFVEVGFSQKDMDFLEQRKFSREEILMIFGIPPSMLIPENSNRAVAEAAMVIFAEQTMEPIMRKFIASLNEFLAPEFDGKDELFFDFNSPVPRNIEQDLAIYQAGISGGFLSPNEVREELNRKPFEGGEQIFAPFSLQPIGMISDTKSLKRIFNYKRYRRSGEEKVKDIIGEIISGKLTTKKSNRLLKIIRGKKITEKFKEIYWKTLIRKTDNEEKKFKDILKKLFVRQENLIVNSLEQKAVGEKRINYEFNLDLEIAVTIKLFRPIVVNIIKEHGRDALAILGIARENFNPTSAFVQQFIETKGLEFAKGINQTTKDKINNIIGQGITEGAGLPEIRKRIITTFEGFKKSRAATIARTEVARSANWAIMEGYRQSGVVEGKEWITALDERVRPTHADMHGVKVRLNEDFPIGVDPGEEVNCRCTTIPVQIK